MDMLVQSVDQLWIWFTSLEAKTVELILAGMSFLVSALILQVYRKQTALKRLEQRPILHTNQYRIPSGDTRQESTGVVINLSNYGKGSATTMESRVSISPVRIDIAEKGNLGMARLWFREKIPYSAAAWTRLTTPEGDEDTDWNEIYGSKIGPSESEEYNVSLAINTNLSIWPDALTRYWSKVAIWRTQNPHVYRFTSALSTLYESTEDDERDASQVPHYRLKVRIEHGNPVGYRGQEPVFDYIIPPGENLTLKEALQKGCPYEEFKDNPKGYLDSIRTADI